MTITQLKYTLAVAEYKNFTVAAEHCFVTQPTLSMQIQKLEDELEIISSVISKTKTSFIMKQVVKLDQVLISEAETHLVTVNQEGKPVQIPKILNDFLD